MRLAATPPEGLGVLTGLAAGDPVGVGVLDMAGGDIDADGELCADGPGLDPHALAIRARTHTICPFLMVLPVVTLERWSGYATIHKRYDRLLTKEPSVVPTKTVVRIVVKPPADGGHHHQRGSKIGGPGWGRTNDQPIMRPATDRLRECQGVSGVLNKHERRGVLVSQSVLECHAAVVKTVVKTDALRFARAGANAGGKISQEFTWCLTACQDVSWRVRASQAVSRTASRRRLNGLPASKPGDTVHRMVQGSRDVQEVEADAGESRWSARPAAAWHGMRITVPSIAFAAVSAGAACGYPSKLEGPR